MTKAALFLVAVTVGAVMAAPQGTAGRIFPRLAYDLVNVVEQFTNFISPENWRWGYTLNDGTTREEETIVENNEVKVKGSYMWIAADGTVHKMGYVSDKDGYRASTEAPNEELLDRLGTNAGLSLIG